MPDATNPYGSSHQPSNSMACPGPFKPRPLAVASRTMAGVLAAGATAWAVFCVLLVLAFPWRGVLIFGPGYIVTFCYYWRAIACPPLILCRVIWGISLLVQGAWLALISSFGLPDLHELGKEPLAAAMVVWWGTSTVISLVGLLIDPGEESLDSPGY